MKNARSFYIDGQWVQPVGRRTLPVINPATEEPCAEIACGEAADVDKAVAAARRAFASYSQTTRQQRLDLLSAVLDVYRKRSDDLAAAISTEMGAPITLSKQAQVPAGMSHLRQAIEALKTFAFEERINNTQVAYEPIGVCGLITPWNWPMNQVVVKVAPALAAGCAMILKPSEISPLSALIFAEILDEAGVPPGVFNLVNGDGPTVGHAISTHPGVDMVSFTGSTRAGILIAKAAADTVKRVHQELGGKSPNIILADADLEAAITHGARTCFNNSGQSCNAPTRLLVPRASHAEAVAVAANIASTVVVGDPKDPGTVLGPVANATQFARVQKLIEAGMKEGATLAAGGPGRPENLNRGYYVRPTVFADVTNDMMIAREEIFGPVLSILPYESEDQAVEIANDTVYGLAGYVTSGDIAHARAIARRLRAGTVNINGARVDHAAAFGGYKQSGNGREWGKFGLESFLEVKSMFGYETA